VKQTKKTSDKHHFEYWSDTGCDFLERMPSAMSNEQTGKKHWNQYIARKQKFPDCCLLLFFFCFSFFLIKGSAN